MEASPRIVVRAARIEDYVALCGLFGQLDEFHRRARPSMFKAFPPPARARHNVNGWLVDADTALLVAESAEGLLGLALLFMRPPSTFAGAIPHTVVEIDQFVVREDQRRRGIGQFLLAEAMEWVRLRQATHVEVVVHDVNVSAASFYKAFGFEPSTSRLMLAI